MVTRRDMLGLLTGAAFAALASPVRAAELISSPYAARNFPVSQRLLLGDGHLLLALALIDPEPASRVVAWQGDFVRYSRELYNAYRKRFPEIDGIKEVGTVSPDTFSLEGALAAAPDVAILGGCYGPGPEDKQLIARLSDAGIPSVFVDFYVDPLANTAMSMRLIGKVLGGEAEQKANAYAEFYEYKKHQIVDRLAEHRPAAPSVLLNAQVGVPGWNCCWMPGNAGLGKFIDAAGGRNIGRGLSDQPWILGQLEYVLEQNPDIVVTTGGPYAAKSSGTVIGPGVGSEKAKETLLRSVAASEIASLRAVRNSKVFAFWHLLHATPLNIIALEAFAKWFHPDLFPDIDPVRTLDQINQQFLAVPLEGCLTVGLNEDRN